MDEIRRSLIIPDTHRPYHSRRAYNVMLEIASHAGVDEIVILGDYGDFYPVNAHPGKHPKLPQLLSEELESVNQGLDELDRLFPKAKKIYLEGNHEYRLERYLFDKAPALFGLTSCRELFRIAQRPRWSYLSYQRNQKYRVLGSDLYARHTPLAANALTGLRKALVSYIHGHTHQISEARAVGLDGRELIAMSPGWLGDARLRAFDYLSHPEQWAHGFAFVSVEGSSKSFHHEIIQIQKNFTALYNGKKFKA